jgi:hypothetical protein
MTMGRVKSGDVHPCASKPTHVKGINEGNAKGNYDRMTGHKPDGTSTAARSTGVASTEPVDPSMPNLSPA